ncbi:putative beta-D-xylosidase 6 [Nymphaea thermarum]|nr:putative beta-D-xylosidase 6 [Nymphaea thermarum]
MDINCGTYLLRHTQAAVEKGKLTESDIDRALFNLFTVQLRLGVFDGDPRKQRYGGIQTSEVCSSVHRQLALEAARQGIVLLKNEKNFLPLTASEVESIAIIGSAANDTNILGGDYTGFPCDAQSILYAFQNYIKNVSYAGGCRDIACNSSDGFQQAVGVAKMVDTVIIFAGVDLSQEKEDLDRTNLTLPGKQQDLVLAVAKVSKIPVILVLVGGGPVDVSFARDNELIGSILWIGYPGEAGGQAVTEVIFGEHNPGGRLPVTWYPESFTSVPMNNMNMRPNASRGYPGRTYRFYTGEVIYEFGHGLSYTNYSYKIISAPEKVSVVGELYENYGKDHFHIDELPSCEKLAFSLHVSVFNEGNRHGSNVIMLFSSGPKGFKGAPRKQLIGFERVHVKSQKSTNVIFMVRPCEHLSLADENGQRIIAIGAHVIMVGGEQHIIYVDN